MKFNQLNLLAAMSLFMVSQGFGAPLDQTEQFNRNRFSLSFNAGFNVRAEFRNLAPNMAPPPATGSGLTGDPINRNYQNGYNRVDFFGNGSGLTWNWGYDSSSQYVDTDNDTVPDSIAMHALARNGSGSSTDATDDPQLGFELKYGRVINKLGENKPWGFDLGFSYMNLSIQDDGMMAAVQRITDTYSLGGVAPPPAPYQGTFNGPGPLIEDLPTRSIQPALLSGWNELSGNLFAIRLGPFLDIPLGKRFVSQFGLGLSLIYADTEYSYQETVAFTDGSFLLDSGRDSSSDVLVGGYLLGQIAYFLNEDWSVFGGLRLEMASDLTATAGHREARLELGPTFHVIFGTGYSF
jgi:hypothetical protein